MHFLGFITWDFLLLQKNVTRIPLINPRKEQCSLCTMGFSPSMSPLTGSELMKSRDQSEKILPASYASQFQTSILDKDSPLLPQTYINLQQNNRVTDSFVHYGALLEESTLQYQSNGIPNFLNKASSNSSNAHEFQETLLDKDGRALHGLQNNGDNYTLFFSFPNQTPNIDMDGSLWLMSSVVVSDASELQRPGEHVETQPLAFAEAFLPQRPDTPEENSALDYSSEEHGNSQYRLQQPAQLSFTNGTLIYEKPYMLHQIDSSSLQNIAEEE